MLSVSDLRCIFPYLPADWPTFSPYNLSEYLEVLLSEEYEDKVDELQLLHMLLHLYDTRIQKHYPFIYQQACQAMTYFTHVNRIILEKAKIALPSPKEKLSFYRNGLEFIRFVPILDFGDTQIKYGLYLASYCRAVIPPAKRISFKAETHRQLIEFISGLHRHEIS